jgi:signal recognition particle subunit SRP54
MFDQLSGRLSAAVASLRGRGRLTEGNIADTLREVGIALLEADVALPFVKKLIAGPGAGAERKSRLPESRTGLIGILHRELVSVLGGGGRP